MSWSAQITRRLEGLDIEPHRLAEITEELANHLDDRVEELHRLGTPHADAVRIASSELDRLDIAALARVAPKARSVAPLGQHATSEGWLAGLRNDVGYGLRALQKQPGLTLVALIVLALGIGGSAGIFSVVNAVLLRPLPFAAPEELVKYWGTAPEKGLPVVNYPDALYVTHSTRVRTMSKVAMYGGAGFVLTGRGEAQRLVASNVTSEFFSVLGVPPAMGRDFTAEEATRGNNLVAILSHGLWQRSFGGDSSIVGQRILLNDLPTTVVGVMPSGFDFPDHSELWVPLGINPTSVGCWCYSAIGRVRPGVTPDDVAAEVDAINATYFDDQATAPPRPTGRRTIVTPLAEDLVGQLREPVVILLCAVGAVLLIACANLANLLLARASARQREFAIRACLGASPPRIVRQLLVEGFLLAAGGALLGLILTTWVSRALGAFVLERLPHLQRIAIDGWVIVFTVAVTVLTVLLFGLAPALRSRRIDLQVALREGSRSSRGAASRRLGNGFVVAQVALSLVLLVSAGLLVRSFRNLLREEAGFDGRNTVVARLSTAGAAYRSDTAIRLFYQRLESALGARPEFSAFALSSTAPFSSGNHQRNYFVEGKALRPGQPELVTSERSVSTAYFRTVGTAVLQGRSFTEQDRPGGELVAIIDESLARLEFPRGDAIGRRVRFQETEPWRTIVGVVRSIKHGDLAKAPDRYVYLPQSQAPEQGMDIIVRTTLTPGAAAALMRTEVRSLDPALPLFDVHTIAGAVQASLGIQRLLYRLLLAFAVAALALAAIGLYGVSSLNVMARFREFGVRSALGATPRALRDMVLRGGLGLALAGIGFGLVAAIATTSLLRTLLFGIAPLDPLTFGVVAVALTIVVIAASYLPARRAMRADPLQALRQD